MLTSRWVNLSCSTKLIQVCKKNLHAFDCSQSKKFKIHIFSILDLSFVFLRHTKKLCLRLFPIGNINIFVLNGVFFLQIRSTKKHLFWRSCSRKLFLKQNCTDSTNGDVPLIVENIWNFLICFEVEHCAHMFLWKVKKKKIYHFLKKSNIEFLIWVHWLKIACEDVNNKSIC